MVSRRIVCVMVVCVLVLALPAWTQERTGKISGRIIDQGGIGLAGVTINAASDVLMGGTRIAITGETGAYRFAALPPGVYAVTASLTGFQILSTQDVRVSVGATAVTDFQMQEQFSEEVTVFGESPLVDVTSSSVGDSFTAEFIKDLPTTRNFYDMMSVSKGVALSSEDSDRLIIGGSNMQSNNWYIDGIETTAPETGTAWVYVNPDIIAELQVVSIGASAEYGNMMGGTLNVVTKSGSNQLKGGVNFYFFDNSLVDSNINFDESEFSEFNQTEFYDITATLGGPIVKDRLWFFAGYEYWRDGHAFPGSDPEITPTWYADRYDFKLSARITDSHMLDGKYYNDDWGYPWPASEFFEPSATGGEIGDTQAWGLSYTGVFTDRTFMEARYTGWTTNDDDLSQTGSTEPAYIDYTPTDGGPTRYWGGKYYPWTYDTNLDQYSVSVSHFADDFIKGSHDFKFGVQASSGIAETAAAGSATGIYYYRYAGSYEYYGYTYDYESFYKITGRPYMYGNDQDSWAAFINDSWTITDRLTINLGVRYDSHTGKIPSFPRLGFDWQPTGEIIPGVDPMFEWGNWSPRIGFAYAAGADQNTVIRGSFGVYYDGNVGGNWNYPPPFAPSQFYATGDSFDGPWEDQGEWWSPGVLSVDPNLKSPKTLQYSVSFEKAIGNKYSFGVTGLYKDTSDLVGWEIMDDGVYEEVDFTDPFTGNTYTLLDPIVVPTVRKGNQPGFTIDPNVDAYWQDYWAVILSFNRRFTDFWSMNASYTYSESTGLIPRFQTQTQFNPFYGSKVGSDPNEYLNANGQNLQGDRPHMFRIQANFELGKGWHTNTLLNLQNGRPYARLARSTTFNRPDLIMEPASDSQRHPFQSLWDIGVGKRFAIGGSGEINLGLQILNVLNNSSTDLFETLSLAEGDDFLPNTWIKPRRIQLRAGINF